MAFRRRAAWTELSRRQWGRVRGRFVGLWIPVVRSRVRLGVWLAFAPLVATAVTCFGLFVWHEWQAHARAGVSTKHAVRRIDGQPFHTTTAGSTGQRLRFPMTEEQFSAWEDHKRAATFWARRMAVFGFAAVPLFALGCRLSDWSPPKTRRVTIAFARPIHPPILP